MHCQENFEPKSESIQEAFAAQQAEEFFPLAEKQIAALDTVSVDDFQTALVKVGLTPSPAIVRAFRNRLVDAGVFVPLPVIARPNHVQLESTTYVRAKAA